MVTTTSHATIFNEVISPSATKAEIEPETMSAVAHIPQDNENNNVTLAASVETQVFVPTEPVPEVKAVKTPAPAPVVLLDVNDTNNNNYQKVTKPEANEEKEVPVVTKKEIDPIPQDTNNNSTDDKAVMISPSIRQTTPVPAPSTEKEENITEPEEAVRKVSVEGPIDYDDGQWSPANLSGRKYYTRDQLLKLKDQPFAIAAPIISNEDVASVIEKDNGDGLLETLNDTNMLFRRFSDMLYKLRLTNFDLMVAEMKTYQIDTSERLDGVSYTKNDSFTVETILLFSSSDCKLGV